MQLIGKIPEMRNFSRAERAAGGKVAFVPTMGFLHEGHGALLSEGKRRAQKLVLSIFVNPTQFDRKDDFDKYPRDTERDLSLARGHGVDAVFLPEASEMYPEGYDTYVSVGRLAEPLCGGSRPGHFRGVATVVAKLFAAVEPDVALFGEKDYQQLAVIRRMTRDLNLPVEIVGMPTIREKDGLALSSRNARLSKEARAKALVLYRSIQALREAYRKGERGAGKLESLARKTLESEGGVRVDYAQVRDAESLEELGTIERPAVYAVAAFVGDVRLIDNTVLGTA